MANSSLSACLAEIKANTDRFYVYLLLKPDGLPFYVGHARSGSRIERVVSHLREASSRDSRRSRNPHKLHTIRSILRAGLVIGVSIDSWHLDRAAAAQREIELISRIGRRDIRTGPLTNLTGGGEGPTALSEEALGRWRAAAARGREKSAIWKKENPEKLAELGRKLGRSRVQWLAENPVVGRAQLSAAGRAGIRAARETINANPDLKSAMRERLIARNKASALENPEF